VNDNIVGCQATITQTDCQTNNKSKQKVTITASPASVCESHALDKYDKEGKGSPYSITECRVLELIPVLGSQTAGGASHKPGARLPLLGLQLPLQVLRGLLPISLLGEQSHNGCEQFAS